VEQLEGRVAVITGGANGIGFATAQALVAERMAVVVSDVDPDALREAVERLVAQGGDVHGVVADVTDPVSVEALAEAAIERFGALHVAVNNAGIVNRGLTWELELEEWHRILDVDLWGVIHGVRSFVPRLLAHGEEGHVVNVASMAAVDVVGKLGPYTVAKHGVLGLSDVLRADLVKIGAPIGVSVVMPGLTKSKMVPIGARPASGVADNIVDAIKTNRAYVYSDEDSEERVAARLHALIDARRDVVPAKGD
jgi:NAD(P)-dependent dehydrogenase (short-subunit alcohol dehydrogenase family)